MPWDYKLNRFESPNFDSPPITFIAQNVLNLIAAEQVRAFGWWNTRWSEAMSFTLQPIEVTAMEVGIPLTFLAKHLYAIPNLVINEGDNSQEERMNLTLLYLPGKPQLEGEEARRFGHVIAGDFYNKALLSIIQAAPSASFTAGWPTGKGIRPAEVKKFLKLQRPDANLINAAGVQSAIVIDLLIDPYPIYKA